VSACASTYKDFKFLFYYFCLYLLL